MSYGTDGHPLGEQLRRLRTERDLTQRELAEPHYTAAYVSSVESGRRSPSGDALRHFAERLGIDVEELRTGRSPLRVVTLDLEIITAATATLAGELDPAEARLRLVLREADRLDQPRQAGRALLWLARIARLRRDTEGQAGHVAAAERALAADTPPLRALVTASRAAMLVDSGEAHYAVYLLESCHDGLVQQGYPEPTALLTLRAQLAAGHLGLGNTDRAGDFAVRALQLTRHGNPAETTAHYVALAHAQLAGDHLADAAVAAAHAHDAVQQQVLRPEIAQCHRASGHSRHLAGDLLAALESLHLARAEILATGQPATAHTITVEIAEIRRKLGQLDLAEELLREVLSAGNPAGSPPDSAAGALAADVHYQLGEIAVAHADPVAEDHFHAAIELATRHGCRGPLVKSLSGLGKLLHDQGRLVEAAEVLRGGLLTLDTATG